MGNIRRALHDISLERGRRNKERFFEAMKAKDSSVEMPKWFVRAYHASRKEDLFEGKDAIIETKDVGKLFIQIKSSYAGAQNFLKGKHCKHHSFIGVIVIHDNDTNESIRTRARRILSKLRQDILEKRNVTA
jgi:hypothetical protein